MHGLRLIFQHEIAKIFKDKSLIFGFFVLPVLSLMITVGISMIRPTTTQAEEYCMYFYGLNLDRINIGELDEKQIYVVSITEDPAQFMQSEQFHKYDVLVDFSDLHNVNIYYHEEDTVSSYLKSSADSFVREIYSELFRGRHPEVTFRTVLLEDLNKKEADNRLIAMLLPYMLILPLTANISNFAADTIAGEKQRGTFYQALLSPITPLSLIMGKIWSVSLISLFSSGIYIGLDVLGSKICEANGWEDLFGFAGIHVTTAEFLLILLYAVLLCYLFSNLGIFISLFCKNANQAQIAQLPVTLACTMAAMLAMFRFGTSPMLHYLIPVYNICIVFQDVLHARVQLANMAMVAISLFVMSVLLLILTLASYRSEKVTE